MLGFEHGDEIFVAELVLWSVRSDVVLVCFRPGSYIFRGYHSLLKAGTE